jgi:acyl-CoA synthetase (AMP-forming)/AMP-acid ligase II
VDPAGRERDGEMPDDDQDRYRRGAGPRRPWPDPVVPDTSLPEFLLATATQQAERAAIIDASSGRTLSYAELADGVRRVASGLAALGLRPGDVFAIMAPNSPEWLLACCGALAARGVVTCSPWPSIPR